MIESASMATTSLISLVQLLDKVKNMVISDYIQQEVSSAKVTVLFAVISSSDSLPGMCTGGVITGIDSEGNYYVITVCSDVQDLG